MEPQIKGYKNRFSCAPRGKQLIAAQNLRLHAKSFWGDITHLFIF